MTHSSPTLIELATTIYHRTLAHVSAVARTLMVPVLRYGLALVMLWFGIPKFLPGGSPAESIAVDTVSALTSGVIAGDLARILLGLIEVGLGIMVLVPRTRPLALVMMLGHMAATFTPLFLFPDLAWHAPFVGSLEGQYIIKNVLVVGGILTLLAHDPAVRTRRNTVPRTPQHADAPAPRTPQEHLTPTR